MRRRADDPRSDGAFNRRREMTGRGPAPAVARSLDGLLFSTRRQLMRRERRKRRSFAADHRTRACRAAGAPAWSTRVTAAPLVRLTKPTTASSETRISNPASRALRGRPRSSRCRPPRHRWRRPVPWPAGSRRRPCCPSLLRCATAVPPPALACGRISGPVALIFRGAANSVATASTERRRATIASGMATTTEPRHYRVSEDVSHIDADADIGLPARFPFTRGIQPTMYRGRPWTMRQYAGFRHRRRIERALPLPAAQGVNGLSVAFDLPTQIGYDSDHPLAAGEVGRVGVAIDSIEDMAALFDGIPLDAVSTSMTINATAIILLALYVAVAQAAGRRPPRALSGHGAERHPQGVRRARHLHLSAAAVAAASSPTSSRSASASCRSGTRSRSAATTSARRARRRCRKWPSRWRNACAYVEACVDAGPRRERLRPAAVVLLQRAQRLPRGDRQVPRGAAAVGAHHARPVRRDRTRARSSCASTRRPPAAR